MIDLPSLAIVLGGTAIATVLQAGIGNCRTLLRAIGGLFAKPFDAATTKAELARQIVDLERDGLVRARPAPIHDSEFGSATSAMIRNRSLDALIAHHEGCRAVRATQANAARGVLMQAAEMAQVMGLAGTLIGLASMSVPQGGAAVASAIALAVLTTLYGVVLANFVCLPLAGMIDRRARAEDAAREELYVWLQGHARQSAPRLRQPPEAA